jgi:HAD superfamily hydrolase (TIGR01509 family)
LTTGYLERPHWVFDLDGTLTRKVHDFPAIKRGLGLPHDRGILEAIETLGSGERARVVAELEAIEWELAGRAVPADGAVDIVSALHARGARLGIVTRNKKAIALRTLARAGFGELFAEDDVLGRDEAAPKPAAEGVRLLLQRFGADARSAVMVGDHLHDLVAGRGAGAFTVYVDETGTFEFRDHADACVHSLSELRDRRVGPP